MGQPYTGRLARIYPPERVPGDSEKPLGGENPKIETSGRIGLHKGDARTSDRYYRKRERDGMAEATALQVTWRIKL